MKAQLSTELAEQELRFAGVFRLVFSCSPSSIDKF
jgi:hypothetical protein